MFRCSASREAQERECQERARAEMSWKIQPQRSSPTALLHRGGCATYTDQVGLISRENAMVALAQPDVESCEVCRPQTGLQG
ncbi:DUF6233 domain-containing protein [Streptomyces sp. NBC_01185]|uniref:DUF6233 domain-containing protein n=1 Tax=Streptomyces sp. NBC_01185 TaxID=2903764 RepID=UPI00386D19A5|nr:DUF6233 domain-containing protein [Streptomyces sp. NBC_01185]